MSQFQAVLTDNEVKLTPTAIEKMAELFSQADDIEAIRVFVNGGENGLLETVCVLVPSFELF